MFDIRTQHRILGLIEGGWDFPNLNLFKDGCEFPIHNILYPNPQLRTSLDFQMHLELQILLPTATV